MELSRTKRLLLGLALFAVVIFTFIAGYMLANVKPSKKFDTTAKDEIIDILDKYYYKDFNKDNSETESLKAFVKSLDDPYTYLYTSDTKISGGYFGYGFGSTDTSMGLKVTKVYQDSPAYNAGIKEDDVIIGVDEVTMINSNLDAITKILKEAEDEVELLCLRDYKKYSVKIKKAKVTVNDVEHKLIGELGYIKLNEFSTGSSKKFKEALTDLESKNIKGLIIDVRNNPGGLATEVASILRNFITGTDTFLTLEHKDGTSDKYRAEDVTKKSYDIKILMNHNTASASEVFALAMNRMEGYDLIGENTYGKNVFQSDFQIKSLDNTYLHVTLGYWYGYNKERITSEGIEPTIKLIDDKYIAMPINNETYELDMADDEIKNIELMLDLLGENVRTDGYFDNDLKTLLETKYESSKLDYDTKKKIYDAYNAYIENSNNDKVLSKAIELLN